MGAELEPVGCALTKKDILVLIIVSILVVFILHSKRGIDTLRYEVGVEEEHFLDSLRVLLANTVAEHLMSADHVLQVSGPLALLDELGEDLRNLLLVRQHVNAMLTKIFEKYIAATDVQAGLVSHGAVATVRQAVLALVVGIAFGTSMRDEARLEVHVLNERLNEGCDVADKV